jgi:hypothetical protein
MTLGKNLCLPLLLSTVAYLGCADGTPTEPAGADIDLVAQWAKGGGKPNPHLAGNNLSFPVIWAEGVVKTPPGTPGMEPMLLGPYWYQWGTNGVDPDVVPVACSPDPDEGNGTLNPGALPLCDDGVPDAVDLNRQAGLTPADNPLPLARAYLQKEPLNQWQATSWPLPFGTVPSGAVNVDLIDWGDNLESVDWYTRSQVRTEVVLFEQQTSLAGGDGEAYGWPLLPAYEMRHTSGWGIDEVHGLAGTLEGEAIQTAGTEATVFSPCARFMIQRLLTDRDDVALADLIWEAGLGWTEPEGYEDDLINPPIFNKAVHEAADGPGYYNAEINVKGRIIFSYTWSVRKLNEGAGDYRLTFSLDEVCGSTTLNTHFVDGVTTIKVPEEEDLIAAAAESDEGGDTGGGTSGLDFANNLTFIDISILQRGGGGGGGGKGGGRH